MPSLQALRDVIFFTLDDRAGPDIQALGCDSWISSCADGLTDAVACFIATEAMLEATLETNRQQIHEAVSNEIPPIEAFADVPAPTEDAESTSGRCRSVFAWPPGGTVTECEVLRSDGQWLRFELRDGRWERNARGWRLAARPLVWRHSLETPADGGFGARHAGRPRLTACQRCKDTGQEPPRERMFFPFAYCRPGGDHWLRENGHGNKRASGP